MTASLRGLVAGILLAFFGHFASAQSTLHSRDAILPQSTLVELEQDGTWSFESQGKRQSVPASDIVRWGAWQGIQQQSAVWLSDGSWLAGRIQFQSSESLTLQSDWFEPTQISLRAVRGLVLIAPASLNAWNTIRSEMEASTGGRDVLWMTGGRQIAGVLRMGASESLTLPRLTMEYGGQESAIESQQVRAIVFSPTLMGDVPKQSGQRTIGMEDGTRLNIRSLRDVASRVQVTLSDGLVLRSLDTRSEFCRGITSLTNVPKGVQFAADLTPASYKHIAQSQLSWPLGKDRDLHGRPFILRTSDTVGIVDRGVAMHSASQVAFRLDGKAAKFLAEVAMALPFEGAEEGLGNANCQVMLARNGKLQTVATIRLDRLSPQSQRVEVDLSEAQLLVLVTEQDDYSQFGDHVLWLDARIVTSK